MSDELDDVRAELARWKGDEEARQAELAEIRAELIRRGALPAEPHPELVEIAQELGRRYAAGLAEVDEQKARIAVDPTTTTLAELTRVVALLTEAITAFVDRQKAPPPMTIKHVERDSDGNIVRIIDEPFE